MKPRLLLASTNKKKASEVRAILGELAELETLADHPGVGDIEEDGETFEANARKKAEVTAARTGRLVLADDSGLAVDALAGAPGVRSARYAEGTDRDRWEKLLAALAGVPKGGRTARFVCVLALAEPGRETVIATGVCEGVIAEGPRGEGGFGYDPIFLVGTTDRSMAELSMEEKNVVSHRGRALAAISGELRARLQTVRGALP